MRLLKRYFEAKIEIKLEEKTITKDDIRCIYEAVDQALEEKQDMVSILGKSREKENHIKNTAHKLGFKVKKCSVCSNSWLEIYLNPISVYILERKMKKINKEKNNAE